MRAYSDTRSASEEFLSDAEVLEVAANLVDDFLSLTRDLHIDRDIVDEHVLPISKATLENAFRLEIATTTSPERRPQLVAAGKLLAQFQPDVGYRITLSPAVGAGGEAGMNSSQARRIEAILDHVDDDRARLAASFKNSESIAKGRFESQARPPFHEDGTYAWHGHQVAPWSDRGHAT